MNEPEFQARVEQLPDTAMQVCEGELVPDGRRGMGTWHTLRAVTVGPDGPRVIAESRPFRLNPFVPADEDTQELWDARAELSRRLVNAGWQPLPNRRSPTGSLLPRFQRPMDREWAAGGERPERGQRQGRLYRLLGSRLRATASVVLALVVVVAVVGSIRQRFTRATTGPTDAPVPAMTTASTPDARTMIARMTAFFPDAPPGGSLTSAARANQQTALLAASHDWPVGTRLRLRRASGGPGDRLLTRKERQVYFRRTVVVTVARLPIGDRSFELSPAAYALLGRPSEDVIWVVTEGLSTDQTAPTATPQITPRQWEFTNSVAVSPSGLR